MIPGNNISTTIIPSLKEYIWRCYVDYFIIKDND